MRTYFAKGKRGIIYIEKRGKTKVAIKTKNPKSEAHGRILNEGHMMGLLNKYGIGPKLISYDENEVSYVFVEGELILDFIESKSGKQIQKTLLQVLDQCRTMDAVGIVKEEMNHPTKHILVTKKGPVMIDFERAHIVKKPHNVTQFVQFLTSTKLSPQLRRKGIFINISQIRLLAGEYKKDQTKKRYKSIKQSINLLTPFQAKVLNAVSKIPKGRVATYQDIARLIGSNAVRAVGTAISKNPCAPKIPCHRVVRGDGTIGKYSGEEHLKDVLLRKEGIKIKDKRILNFNSVRIS